MKMRRNVRKSFFVGVAALTVTFAFGLTMGGYADGADLPKSIAIGTTSVGSAPYVVSVGIAHFISKYTKINATAESSGGGDSNVRLLRKGVVQAAMANSFTAEHAYKGDVQFKKDGKIPVRALIWGNSSLRQPVVRASAGIKTIADFAGKRILGRRRIGADTLIVYNALIKAYGVDPKSIKLLTYNRPKEIMDALKSGTAHGAIWPATPPNPLILRLQEAVDLAYPTVSKDKWDAVLKEMGDAFFMATLPANTYKNQPTEIYVPSLQMGFAVLESFSEEAAYQITKAVMGHYNDFKLIHPSAKQWTPKRSLNQFCVPFHPGAIKYYREIGAWTAEQDKRQKAVLALGN